jgi:Cof subfamily protein (haloacid dehalogenase superfamily)
VDPVRARPTSECLPPIRLIAVDLDGTLLNSGSEISNANREALAAAAARGIEIVVVTGRRFHSARRFVEQIPAAATIISSNGARIGSLSGEVYHCNFLPAETALDVLRATRDYRQYAVLIYDTTKRGQVILERGASPAGPLGWYLKNAREVLAQVPDLEAAVEGDPIQVMFGGPPVDIEPVEPLLRDSSAAPHVHLTWTKYPARNVSILDVLRVGCSKGAALAMWAARSGVRPSEVMAIGDNHNDAEMLRFAGWPVLMANGSADLGGGGYLCTLSNDDDGVAYAVRKYALNDEP